MAGLALARGGADRTTVSNLLEVFQSEAGALDATSLLLAHIMRQVGRGEIRRDCGSKLLGHLSEIFNSFKGEELKTAVLKYLTLSKWVFEASPRVSEPITGFKDLIRAYLR
ncbi:hypothetical protein KEJ49_04625 [Candidatus Bathyarchaeota archaeon]|nr:hypothetical protein [Candidatus Bathyarchaeota archaeon]